MKDYLYQKIDSPELYFVQSYHTLKDSLTLHPRQIRQIPTHYESLSYWEKVTFDIQHPKVEPLIRPFLNIG
jgi:hypothetical protein